MSQDNIKDKFFNATKWASITEIVAKMITPISNIILARIISPEAFGVVATITMIISFADMFTDSGFQKYLIQHDFVNEDEKFKNANVAFLTNLAISVVLLIIIVIFREKIAIMVGNEGLGNVIAISSIQIIFTAFSSIQMALYRRDFDFKTLFTVRIVSIFIPFIITIPLALLGMSYWSIIIGTITMQLYNAVILTIKSKWKPNLFFEISMLKKMFSFSIWSLIEAISIWLTGWIDMFIIGSAISQYYLGIYKTSISMVNTLMGLITASIIPVSFSILCRLQNDNEKFNNMYFSIQKLMSMIVFPLGVGIFLYSDLVTKILLGNKWAEASRIIGLWGLTSSIMIVMGNLASEAYRAKGKPKLSFLAQILHLVVLVPVCIIGAQKGFNTLIHYRAWIRIEFIIVHLILMSLVINISIKNTIENIFPVIVSTFIMGIFGYVINQQSSGILWQIISVLLCIIVYISILSLFSSTRTEVKKIIKFIQCKFRKKVL